MTLQEDTRVEGGVAEYAYAVERALEEYDVRHAHVDSRAKLALRTSAELEAKIRREESNWTALERELDQVSGLTSRVWEQGESLGKTVELMSEIEEMLLEAEIGIELEALYRRRDDAEAKEAEADKAFKAEVEQVLQLHDMLVSDAMTNQASSRTMQEIAAEQDLKKKLASLAKKKSKDDAADEQTLKDIASALDVASSMSANLSGGNLDDFFTVGDDEEEGDGEGSESGKNKAYTLYGLRARADQTKGAILNQPIKTKSQATMNPSEAERIALARKEALGIKDEDMAGVNLRPPPPKGGAHSGPLDDPTSPRRIAIESKSMSHQVSDRLKNFSLESVWESASQSTATAREKASAATAAVAAVAASAASEVQSKSKEAARLLQEQTATLRRTKSTEPEDRRGNYSKKDAGTST